jgi:hypothetical protein
MIEGQFAGTFSAILAGFLIAQQDIGARGLKGDPGYANIGKQLHNYRAFKLKTASRDAFLDQGADPLIDEGDFLFRKKHDETAFWDDRERL